MNSEFLKIELGCGRFPRPGFQGIDVQEFYPGCLVHDLNKGLPELSGPVNTIWADNVLEHITDLITLMNACWHVMYPNGQFHIRVPLANTVGSLKDPTHVRQFVLESFDYFDAAWDYGRRPDYGIKLWNVISKTIERESNDYQYIYVVLGKPQEV
jgi:hypothetical protein